MLPIGENFPHLKPVGRSESGKGGFPGGSGPFQKLEFIPQESPGEKKEASYEFIDPTQNSDSIQEKFHWGRRSRHAYVDVHWAFARSARS